MGASGAQWVISIYALLFGSLLLPAGRLADRVGHRRLFTIGLAAFAAGSLLCGAAPSGAVLVAARARPPASRPRSPSLRRWRCSSPVPTRRADRGRWAGGRRPAPAVASPAWRWAACSPPWRAGAQRSSSPPCLAAGCLPFVSALGPGQARRRSPAARPRRGARRRRRARAAPRRSQRDRAGRHRRSCVGAAGGGRARAARLRAHRGPRAVAAARARASCRSARWRRARWPRPSTPRRPSPLAVLGALYLQDVRGWSPAANGLSFVPFSAMVIVGSMAGATLLRRLGARADVRARARGARGDAAGLVRDQRRLGGGRAHRRAGGRRARAGHRRRRRRRRWGHRARPRTVAAWRRA